MTAQQITKGATVYGVGGEKVGTIQAYNGHGSYLVVRTGWNLPHGSAHPPACLPGDRRPWRCMCI